ncbi:MAG: tetratricopeptide repeat protein [candidate division WOR-3 bacterium]
MKFKVKHRVSKADLKEDKFQEAVEKIASAYYRDRQKFWIGGAVVLAVIIGVILLVQRQPARANVEAELRLTDALVRYAQGNLEEAEQAFRELATRFGRDYAGIKAHYYLGNIYFHAQPPRFEEARREFATFFAKSKNDPVLSPAALMGIANCDEELGNNLRAARTYEAVYRRYQDSPLAFAAMMAAGRAYRNAGKLEKAIAIYEELLKKEQQGGQHLDEVKAELAYVQALKNRF